jgi:hypothetical protein
MWKKTFKTGWRFSCAGLGTPAHFTPSAPPCTSVLGLRGVPEVCPMLDGPSFFAPGRQAIAAMESISRISSLLEQGIINQMASSILD